MKKELTESLEKYLLAIYEIVDKNQAARVKDVSNFLNIGGPATSDAVKTLAARGFINYVPYGIITLTTKGKKTAEEKISRTKIISNFLEKVLMLPEDKIDGYTNEIEFSMSEEVLDRFIKFLHFMESCSCKEPKWVKSYKHYAKSGVMQDKCLECIKSGSTSCCLGCSK